MAARAEQARGIATERTKLEGMIAAAETFIGGERRESGSGPLVAGALIYHTFMDISENTLMLFFVAIATKYKPAEVEVGADGKTYAGRVRLQRVINA